MATTYNRLLIDVNQKIDNIVTAKQNDTASRFLDVSLYSNGVPINLTGHSVKIYFKKPDNTEVFTEGEITDATAGRCQFELTTQTLAVYGDLKAEISIWNGDTEVLTTQTFTIIVFEMLRSDNTVESTNEFGVLVTLFQSIQNSLDLMNAIKTNFGEAGEKAAEYGAATFWRMLEVLAEKTEEAVQYDVSGKIGEPSDTTSGTVFGKFKTDLNSTIGTSNFKPLDETIIDAIIGGSQTFTSNGSFIVSVGVKSIKITAAGGGAGGSGANSSSSPAYGGGGGGGGACIVEQLFEVTPGQTLVITVGVGGAGAAAYAAAGASGSATIVGNLVTLPGGFASTGGYFNGGLSGGAGGGNGGSSTASSLGYPGADGFVGLGGLGGTTYKNGGGGGGSYGNGGDSGSIGANGVYGGGGGGSSNGYHGGKGGDGIVIIEWGLRAA
ncbi:MAG: BppU family phage baseplate upper protein [Anaerotignum sp.]|nr:BppU family phage baseplate upper protein [Anaerotignum sp.]